MRINYYRGDPLSPRFEKIKRTAKAILVRDEFGNTAWLPFYMIDRSESVWVVKERFHNKLSLDQKMFYKNRNEIRT